MYKKISELKSRTINTLQRSGKHSRIKFIKIQTQEIEDSEYYRKIQNNDHTRTKMYLLA